MSFTIRLAREEDGPGICRLFSRVFPREMTLAEWRWKYVDNPDGWLSVVAEVEGEIAGHYGGWGVLALLDGVETPLFSLCDLSTDPALRQVGGRHGMFLAMAEEWNGMLNARHVPFSHGFPGPMAMGAGKSRVGYRQHVPIRELRFALGADEPPAGLAPQRFGPSFDALWEAAAPLVSASCLVRDRARAAWRFTERPDRSYFMVAVEGANGGWTGWGVLATHGADALVLDYLLADARPETFDALWRALRGQASRHGAGELVFWEPPGGPWRPHLLARTALPGARTVDAGFSLATAVLFDEDAFARFARNLHFTPASYDDR